MFFKEEMKDFSKIKLLKKAAYRLMIENGMGRLLSLERTNIAFPGSAVYWERRYQNSGNSGAGSYGQKAIYKANFLNRFVAEKEIKTVIEFGCGDGNQLSYFNFPEYKGFDISKTAVKKCRELFAGDHSKSFYSPSDIYNYRAELAISLDVIYHLVEDEVYENYMSRLFSSASRYVIIYAWDVDEIRKFHVRHRCFSKWITEKIPGFTLLQVTRKPAYCDFFVYERVG